MFKDIINQIVRDYPEEQLLSAIENLDGEEWTTDYRTAIIESDSNGSFGDASKIKDKYDAVYNFQPEIHPSGINFVIKTHSSDFWVAMPLLPFVSCFGLNNILYSGEGFDWQFKLIEETARMCGVEPSNDTIRHMYMA